MREQKVVPKCYMLVDVNFNRQLALKKEELEKTSDFDATLYEVEYIPHFLGKYDVLKMSTKGKTVYVSCLDEERYEELNQELLDSSNRKVWRVRAGNTLEPIYDLLEKAFEINHFFKRYRKYQKKVIELLP